ncbi:MAG: hypothetical protein MUP30_07010 [Deltaproteobacteria bacterium]|nr:hypothetical protein [Deltaproteobacteria bacterium]
MAFVNETISKTGKAKDYGFLVFDKNRVIDIIFQLAVTFVFLLFYGAAFAADSHCLPEEETVFSCAAGNKVISICASKDISTTSGYMQYRFGALNAVEITIPETKEHPKKNVEAGTFSTANGGRTGHIRFKKGEYGYVIYWSRVRGAYFADGTRNWERRQGVVVEYKGEKIANIKCQLPSKEEPDDEYLFSSVGLTKNEDLVYYNVP